MAGPVTSEAKFLHGTPRRDKKQLFMVCHDDTVRVMDLVTGEITKPHKVESQITDCLLRWKSKRCVLVSADRTVRVFDTESGELILPVGKIGSNSPDDWTEISPDGRFLFLYPKPTQAPENPKVKKKDGEIRVWDLATGELVDRPFRLSRPVDQVIPSPDSRFFLSFSYGSEKEVPIFRVWSLPSGEPITPQQFCPEGILDAVFADNGREIRTLSWSFGISRRPLLATTGSDKGLEKGLPFACMRQLDKNDSLVTLDCSKLLLMAKEARTWENFSPAERKVEAWHEMGLRFAHDSHQWDLFRSDVDFLLKRKPKDPRLLKFRANVNATIGNWAEALGNLEAARKAEIETSRDEGIDVEIWRNLACIYLKNGDAKKSRDIMTEAFKRFTDEADQLDLLRVSVLFQDTPATARDLAAVDKAMARYPGNCDCTQRKGAVLFRAGRYADAVNALDQAARESRCKGAPQDWLFLAMAHYQLKDDDKAKAYLAIAKASFDSARWTHGDGKESPISWNYYFELSRVRSEAERLIENAIHP